MSPTPKSCLFDLPAEIRIVIYALATAQPNKIIVRGPDCATPPLAQASRKLREEVIPIWLESNIFHLTDATEIRKWLPININTLSLINSITLDLESSVMWYNTLKHNDIQPTRIVAYEDQAIVSEISVVWASHARIIESLVTDPRRGALMAFSELTGLLDARRAGGKTRVRGRLLEEGRSFWKKLYNF